jgi:glyoxylate reductase
MKAALVDPTAGGDLEFLRGFAEDFELVAAAEGGSKPEIQEAVRGAGVIVSKRRKVDAELMDAAGPGLELIQLWSNRRDRVDLPAARARGLTVALMPQVGCIAVAELALLLMLGLSKKVVQGHLATVGGAYRDLGIEPELTAERKHGFQWMKLPGLFELNGKRLGLVGMGEIATEVARRARAFAMEVSYYSRTRLDPEIEAEEGVTYRAFVDLLAWSDIVSLHVPHSAATERLIDAAALARMRPDAHLVNTCRGGVVDEAALVAALQERRIAGAGLDVFVYEPVPHDHPLLGLDNVLLLPHLGGGSGGARVKQARNIMANVGRHARGETVEHIYLAAGEPGR